MPYLVVENGALRGHRVEVSQGSRIVLGRDPRAHISVDDILCSRKHFVVEEREGSYWIRDLGSSNGTHVNDARISEKELHPGDNIHAGSTQLTFLEGDNGRQGLVGKEVGGYRILERIGRGGMGTVYKALQVSLNRVVALKILSARYSRDPAFVQQFQQEAQAAGRLNHPNIVQVYDVGSDGGLHFYSMEFIEGGSAQDLVNRSGPLSPELALSAITDAAQGLLYAEKKGLVHRDIKPDNLMINAEGVVKIADLGLAHDARELAERASVDEDEGIFGTPHFISPEQARSQKVDTRSDIYSLGATFYMLLTGETPFAGKSVREIIRKQLSEPPPNLREKVRECPPAIAAVVERAMQKDPDQRYQDARELLDDLERTERLMKRGRRGYLVAAGLVALLLGGAGAFAFLGTGGGDGKEPSPAPVVDRDPGSAETEAERRAREEAEKRREMRAKAEKELLRLKLKEVRLRAGGPSIQDLEELARAYREELFEPYVAGDGPAAGTDVARELKQIRRDLKQEIDRRKAEARAARLAEQKAAAAAASQVEATLDEVRQALAAHRYGAALQALKDGLSSEALQDRPEAERLRERRKEVLTAARKRAESVLARAETLTEKEAFHEARSLLEEEAGAFARGVPREDLEQPVSTLVTTLKKKLQKVREAEIRKRAADLRHDQEVGFAARRRAVETIRSRFDPQGVAAELRRVLDELETEAWRELVLRDLADLEAAARIRERVIEQLRDSVGENIVLPSSRGNPLEWNLEAVEDGVLTISRGHQGSITKTYRLNRDFGAPGFYKWLVEDRILVNESTLPDLVRLLVLAGLPGEARKLATEALPLPEELGRRAARELEALRELRAIRRIEKQGYKDPRSGLALKRRLESFLSDHRDSLAFLLNSNGRTPLVGRRQVGL